MSDVNEELVRRYYELHGYFVRSNVRYRFATDKGAGWSDIDLCVLHPVTRDAAIVEVKGWHTERVSPSYLRAWPRLFHFVRSEATEAATKLFGHSDFRRVLVLSRLGSKGRDEILAYAAERGVTILEFPEVLNYLIEATPTNLDAGSETEHVIRMLKIYGLTAPSTP